MGEEPVQNLGREAGGREGQHRRDVVGPGQHHDLGRVPAAREDRPDRERLAGLGTGIGGPEQEVPGEVSSRARGVVRHPARDERGRRERAAVLERIPPHVIGPPPDQPRRYVLLRSTAYVDSTASICCPSQLSS
jgi:hypothetical protein